MVECVFHGRINNSSVVEIYLYEHVFIFCHNGTLHEIDFEPKRSQVCHHLSKTPIVAVGFHPSSPKIIIADENYDLFAVTRTGALCSKKCRKGRMSKIVFSEDFTQFCCACDDGYVKVFRTSDLSQLSSYGVHRGWITGLSADNESVITSCGDKYIRIFSGDCEPQVFGPFEFAPSCFVLHNGVLCVGFIDGSVGFVERQTGRVLKTIKCHDSPVGVLSLKNNVLITGGGDHKVGVVDAEDGELLYALEGHQASITAIDWSKSDNIYVTADTAGEVFMWKMQPEKDKDRSSDKEDLHASLGSASEEEEEEASVSSELSHDITKGEHWNVEKSGVEEKNRERDTAEVFESDTDNGEENKPDDFGTFTEESDNGHSVAINGTSYDNNEDIFGEEGELNTPVVMPEGGIEILQVGAGNESSLQPFEVNTENEIPEVLPEVIDAEEDTSEPSQDFYDNEEGQQTDISWQIVYDDQLGIGDSQGILSIEDGDFIITPET